MKNETKNRNLVVNIDTISELLGVNKQFLYNKIKKGKLVLQDLRSVAHFITEIDLARLRMKSTAEKDIV